MLGRRMLGRRILDAGFLDAKRLRKLVDQLVSINTTARFDFRFRFLIFCVTVFQFQLTGKFCESGRLRISAVRAAMSAGAGVTAPCDNFLLALAAFLHLANRTEMKDVRRATREIMAAYASICHVRFSARKAAFSACHCSAQNQMSLFPQLRSARAPAWPLNYRSAIAARSRLSLFQVARSGSRTQPNPASVSQRFASARQCFLPRHWPAAASLMPRPELVQAAAMAIRTHRQLSIATSLVLADRSSQPAKVLHHRQCDKPVDLPSRSGKVADKIDQQSFFRASSFRQRPDAVLVQRLERCRAPNHDHRIRKAGPMRHLGYPRRLADAARMLLYVLFGVVAAKKCRVLDAIDVDDAPVRRMQEGIFRRECATPVLVVACSLAPGEPFELLTWAAFVFAIGRTIGFHAAADAHTLDAIFAGAVDCSTGLATDEARHCERISAARESKGKMLRFVNDCTLSPRSRSF